MLLLFDFPQAFLSFNKSFLSIDEFVSELNLDFPLFFHISISKPIRLSQKTNKSKYKHKQLDSPPGVPKAATVVSAELPDYKRRSVAAGETFCPAESPSWGVWCFCSLWLWPALKSSSAVNGPECWRVMGWTATVDTAWPTVSTSLSVCRYCIWSRKYDSFTAFLFLYSSSET